MKLACTIIWGDLDYWGPHAERAAHSFQQMTGIESRGFEAQPGDICPKLFLFEVLADGVKEVLYFDADCLACQPFEITTSHYMGAVLDAQSMGVVNDCKRTGLPIAEYFNTGIMMLRRQNHTDMLKAAQWYARLPSHFQDQTSLNIARRACGVPLRALPETYNSFGVRGLTADTLIAHAAGGMDAVEWKEMMLDQYARRWNIADPRRLQADNDPQPEDSRDDVVESAVSG